MIEMSIVVRLHDDMVIDTNAYDETSGCLWMDCSSETDIRLRFSSVEQVNILMNALTTLKEEMSVWPNANV